MTPTQQAAAYTAGWDAGRSGLPSIPPLYRDNADLRRRYEAGWWDGVGGREPQPDRTEYAIKEDEQ